MSTMTMAQRSDWYGAVQPPLEVRSDEALAAAAVGGDQFAFDDLVSRYRHAAVRVAAGIVGPNQAEDVVQDSLLLAYRGLASLKDGSKFSRWLMAITRWRALRVGQQERRHTLGHIALDESAAETLSDLATDPRHTDATDGLLLAALESIPPKYAEVIRYHFLHHLPLQKIAALLDLSLSTVKWRCFRGKEILRCILSPEPACPTVCRTGCARFPTNDRGYSFTGRRIRIKNGIDELANEVSDRVANGSGRRSQGQPAGVPRRS